MWDLVGNPEDRFSQNEAPMSNWKNVTRYANIFTPFLEISFTYPHFFHICVSTHLDKTPLRYSNPRTLELMKNIMRNAQLYFSRVSFFTPVNPENKFHSILLYFSVTSIFAPFLSASQNSFFFQKLYLRMYSDLYPTDIISNIPFISYISYLSKYIY